MPLALVVLPATHRSPSLPVAFSVFSAVAGAVAALLILYRIANQPGPNHAVDVQVGAGLGLAAAVLVAAGAWRSVRVEPSRACRRPRSRTSRRPLVDGPLAPGARRRFT